MHHNSQEITKKENCFTCDKKTKQKKRSKDWEMLSRVERDYRSTTLIVATGKEKDSSNQWLINAPKRLKVMTGNIVVLAADLRHHQSCYSRFVYSYEEKSTTET